MEDEEHALQPGQAVVVRTPDRREYRGHLVEMRRRDGRQIAVVRLDTGWLTSYPASMVVPEER